MKSRLPLSLVAGVVGNAPADSLATIESAAGPEHHLLRVGDSIGGAVLLGLEWTRPGGGRSGTTFEPVAVICNQGTKEYVDAGPHPALGGPGRPRFLEVVPEGDVRPVGPNQYDVDRDFLALALSDLERFPTLARIVPSSRADASGYQVSEIAPGSLLSVLGLEDGDVVERVNGREVGSPEEAFGLDQAVRDSSHLSIELDRRGEPVRLEYNVKSAEAP